MIQPQMRASECRLGAGQHHIKPILSMSQFHSAHKPSLDNNPIKRKLKIPGCCSKAGNRVSTPNFWGRQSFPTLGIRWRLPSHLQEGTNNQNFYQNCISELSVWSFLCSPQFSGMDIRIIEHFVLLHKICIYWHYAETIKNNSFSWFRIDIIISNF